MESGGKVAVAGDAVTKKVKVTKKGAMWVMRRPWIACNKDSVAGSWSQSEIRCPQATS